MDNFLYELAEKTGIILNDTQITQLNKYYELLVEKNKVMNLTSITEYKEVVIKHFIDSIAVINAYDLKNVDKLIDIGTGAGFPGLVLKIVFPEISVTLLDSLNKRINFLNEVIEQLKLIDIKCIHGRAEDYAHNNEYREKYDLCVSRAVANLSTLSEYCLPFVKINGSFISYKAGNSNEEINSSKKAINILGGKINQIKEYTLPDTDIERTFIVVNKIKKTSIQYPRKAGMPGKEPLK